MQSARYIAVGFDDSLPRGLLIKNTKEGNTVLQLTDHCSSIQLFRKGHMAGNYFALPKRVPSIHFMSNHSRS